MKIYEIYTQKILECKKDPEVDDQAKLLKNVIFPFDANSPFSDSSPIVS